MLKPTKAETVRAFFYALVCAFILGGIILAPWLAEPMEIIKARDASIVSFFK